MKSKKSLFILIPLLLVVWGLVVYRIIDFTKPVSDDIPFMVKNQKNKIEKPNDSLYRKLNLNYRDPFLNRTVEVQQVSVFESNPEPKKVVWPGIKFKGYLANGNDQLIILEVDGNTAFYKPMVTEKGIEVINTWNDSVRIKKENEIKTFYKYAAIDKKNN